MDVRTIAFLLQPKMGHTDETDRKQTLCGLKDLSVPHFLRLFFSLTFSLPADTSPPHHHHHPLASASLSHDVLSIDCNKRNRSTACILAPVRTDPCRYLLVKMCYLFVQTLLSNPLLMADLLSRCVWIWIICYDGWTCLVTSCPDVCQSRLSVNRRCWEGRDKTSTEAMQSPTNYHHNDAPQVVCLGFQRFISHMLEWRGNCSATPSVHPVVAPSRTS